MSCARIEIDFGAVGSERLEFPEGTVMDVQHVIRSNSSTVYAYEVRETARRSFAVVFPGRTNSVPKLDRFRPRTAPRPW